MNTTSKVSVYLHLKLGANKSQFWTSSQTCDHDAELDGRHHARSVGGIIDTLRAEFGRGNINLVVDGAQHDDNDHCVGDATMYAIACVKSYLTKTEV